jgi:chemotaxis protein CheC
MMETITLNEMQRDALQEVANIGASHAATALSKMVNRPIQVGIPRVDMVPIEESISTVPQTDPVVGVFLQMSEETPLYVMVLLSKNSAFYLANLLLNQPETGIRDNFSEMEESALMEVSNVMMSSFFNSITTLIDVSMIPGPPVIAFDMPAAILDYALIKVGSVANSVLLFETAVSEEGNNTFDVNMFLIPEPQTIQLMLNKLGMDLDLA